MLQRFLDLILHRSVEQWLRLRAAQQRDCRWNRPNGHPSGEAVFRDHYLEWFLQGDRGADIYHADVRGNLLMDVGLPAFQREFRWTMCPGG